MRRIFTAVMLAAGLIAGAAQADDCGDPGSASAAMVPPAEFDAIGFAVAAQLGLEPKTFPLDDIRKAAAPCRRVEFNVGGEIWTLYGGADGQPPRWAMRGERTNRIAFLAVMPWPKDALAWAERYEKDPQTEASFNRMALALTIAEGDLRKVYILYDSVPTDARLAGQMAAALSGEIKPFATYNVRTHKLQ